MSFYLVLTVNHPLTFVLFIPLSLYNCFLLVRKILENKAVSFRSEQVEKEIAINVVQSVIHELTIGTSPQDIHILVNDDLKPSVDEKINLYCDLFKFYYYLDQENYSKAEDVCKQLEIRLRKTETNLSVVELVTFKNELLYSCYLQRDVVTAKKLYEEIITEKITGIPINMPRALASYHLLTTGDLSSAQYIYKKACRQNDLTEKGLQKFEMGRAINDKFIHTCT